MKKFRFLIYAALFVIGCVPVPYSPRPGPKPNPDPIVVVDTKSAGTALKSYSAKAAVVFDEAAQKLSMSGDWQGVHDFIKSELAKYRSESFVGVDNRLKVLEVDEPDIDVGVQLLKAIANEFREASK